MLAVIVWEQYDLPSLESRLRAVATRCITILSVWFQFQRDLYACVVGVVKTTFHLDTSFYRARETAVASERPEQSLQPSFPAGGLQGVHQIQKAETRCRPDTFP